MELVAQTLDLAQTLCKQISKFGFDIKCDGGDLLVTTPNQLTGLKADKESNEVKTRAKPYDLSNLQFLVVDEADMMLGFDMRAQLEQILHLIPQNSQKVLCSATLSAEITDFSKMMLQNPVQVADEQQDESTQKFKYFTFSQDIDKYYYLYAFFVLKIIKQRTIIYTPRINEAYRAKLFLEKFGQRALMFVPSLPLAQRQVQLQKFNMGVCDILIITAEQSEAEAGVIRGVDFENVQAILTLHFPQTLQEYQHLAGRAGRAGTQGTVISLVIDIDETCQHGQLKGDFKVQNEFLKTCAPVINFEYEELDLEKAEKEFGYRVRDVYSQLNDLEIRKYRTNQLKQLVAENAKLKQYLSQNDKDSQLMKLAKTFNSSSLRVIPEYLKMAAEQIKQSCSLIMEEQKVVKNVSYQKRGAMMRKMGLK